MDIYAECQSCNAPRARHTSKYVNKQDYQQVREKRRSRRVVEPVIETRPARVQQKAAPQATDMIDLQDVVSAEPKPTLQMIKTPQAKAAKQAPAPQMAQAMPSAQAAEIIRPKVHEGINQINYTASLGKTGGLVHIVETKPVQATLSGKIIVPQVVDGQMHQSERVLSADEARMYHQKIKAAAAA